MLSTLLTGSISILYPYVVTQGYNVVTSDDQLPKECTTFQMDVRNDGGTIDSIRASNKCIDNARKKNNNKFIVLIIVALVSLLLGFYCLKNDNENYYSMSLGVVIGSIILMIYQLFTNWYDISNGKKLSMSVIALLIISYLSTNTDLIIKN